MCFEQLGLKLDKDLTKFKAELYDKLFQKKENLVFFHFRMDSVADYRLYTPD